MEIEKYFGSIPESLRTVGQFAFSQVACTSSPAAKERKRNIALATAVIGLFICMSMASVMGYMQAEASIDEKLV